MGKTKIATIDDSQIEVPKAKVSKVSKVKIEETVPNKSAPIESGSDKSEVQNIGEEVSEATDSSDKAGTPSVSESSEKKAKASKASLKKGEPKFRSKKYKEASGKVDKSKRYPVTEAIDLAKQTSYSKFDGSLDMHISTNVKNIRGLVSLPFASGKKLKILAFGVGAKDSGADIAGDDDKLNEIIRGVTGFDVIVTTPQWMPKLARAAKVLGPRGLMPSPKNGTITEDLKKAVAEIQSGKVEYKTEKGGQAIHLTLGKVSQDTDQVVQNAKILFNAIGKTKITKAVVSPSMGVGVKIDLQSI